MVLREPLGVIKSDWNHLAFVETITWNLIDVFFESLHWVILGVLPDWLVQASNKKSSHCCTKSVWFSNILFQN